MTHLPKLRRAATRGLVLLFCAASALGQKQSPPAPGTPKGFRVPATKKFTLGNGLKVTLAPYGTVPKVTVELAVVAGNAAESVNEIWLADLTGDWMREGTATRTGSQISQEAARMGGSLEIGTSQNLTRVTGNALSEFGPEMVRLLADVAENPSFPESELTRLKADMARNLAINTTRPQQIALEKFRGVLYPNHRYGHVFPTAGMVQGYTAAQARTFYGTNFGAARSHLYVAGTFDAAAMEKAIRAAFGSWKAGTPASVAPPTPQTKRAVYLVDRPGAPQSTIVLGVPVVDPTNPDWVPLQVMNTLLGGYFSSRITSNIREAKGYTYSPFSQVAVSYRNAYWAQNADVTTNVTGPSLKEIFSEIDRLQSEPPTPEELRAVQNYMAGVFVLQNSSRPGIIGQLEFVDLHGLPDDYLTEFVRRVNAVTPQAVSETARKYIHDENATIVIVGDRKVIEEQIKPYGTIAP